MMEMGRHSLAHVLAKAVCELFGDVKLAIGPAIDNGFYYDFDLPHTITEGDYANIEAKMTEILKRREAFTRKEISKAEALALFAGNPYKTELIEALPEDEIISVYRTGEDFADLCRGPHVENAQALLSWAFKIASVAGAYWRGDEHRPMLQRVYVNAFPSKAELKAYIAAWEEALKRDHNKLGRSLELFTTADVIGQGLPILLPKGAMVMRTLQRFVEDEEQRRGYQQTMTPSFAKRELYKISGHWDHYRDGMFIMGDPAQFEEEGAEVFALRPILSSTFVAAIFSSLPSFSNVTESSPTAVTFAPRRNTTPRFSYSFSSMADISLSVKPAILSVISITVTRLPTLW